MPIDENFWSREARILLELLFPFVTHITESAAHGGMVAIGLDADPERIHRTVLEWSAQHTAELAARITATSADVFQKHFRDWVLSMAPLEELIQQLEPYYGIARAESIGVTEVTNAFAAGNIEAWKMSGVVEGYDVMTAEDELVCPQCGAKRMGNPYPLNSIEGRPSFHTRCRCWLHPRVSS